jgi:uncharacterized protein (DUF697 family)
MGAWEKINSVWKNVQEVDLRPIRAEAERPLRLVLAGQAGGGVEDLAAMLNQDPWRPASQATAPLPVFGLDQAGEAGTADLVLLMLDERSHKARRVQKWLEGWSQAGRQLLVLIPLAPDTPNQAQALLPQMGDTTTVLPWPQEEADFFQGEFARAVLDALPGRHLALGRQVPGLRPAVAHKLINDTSFSNAAYSLSTGLAEIVPILDIPLNIADILVLTKAQALLVYRLGLALGLPTDWRYYTAELGGVVGGGFLWRQIARGLVGLIPVWGLLPKVAVAYAGTYTVGQVVLRWYHTGRQVSRKELRQMYRQSFEQGKVIAGELVSRVPRPRLSLRRRNKSPAALPEGRLACPHCGVDNEPDARFCKSCGQALDASAANS